MGNFDIGTFILYMVAWLFAASVHEAAHAWMSLRFGDDLAYSQGRVTLNPVAHIDPLGTLLLPALAFFTGGMFWGWAKSTPVNPLRWRNRRVANFWVSFAGVLGNLSIAFVCMLLLRILLARNVIVRDGLMHITLMSDSPALEGLVKLLQISVVLNVTLFFVNLIPIPPLDGASILSSILPETFTPMIESLQQYGFMILIVALFTGIIGIYLRATVPILYSILFLGVPIS